MTPKTYNQKVETAAGKLLARKELADIVLSLMRREQVSTSLYRFASPQERERVRIDLYALADALDWRPFSLKRVGQTDLLIQGREETPPQVSVSKIDMEKPVEPSQDVPLSQEEGKLTADLFLDGVWDEE